MEMNNVKNGGGGTWEVVRLDDLCKMNSGGTPSRSNLSFYNGDIPWAKISDIENAEGGIIQYTEEHITTEGLASINNRIFEKGTLLLAMYGSVGKVAFSGMEMSTNQAILGIKIKDESKLSYSYLKYWFQTIKEKLLNRAVGGTLQNISLGIVKDLQIPLPPLPVQKRIAEILDAADALRRKDQELLQKYDALAQAIFLDMFGDPVKNEKGWECFPVIKYCDCIVPGRDKPKSFSGEIPWITTEDLNHLSVTKNSKKSIGLSKSEIEAVKAKVIPKNSVIMTCVGDLGIISINEQEIVINQQLHAFQCSPKLNPNFLMYNLSYQKGFMYKMSSSTTVPYMNKTVCNSIPVVCPPIKQQNLFEEKINFIIQQKHKIDHSKSNNLFQTLLQKAFKGELVS